ncbi:hypothetical protein Pcinc_004273 [Petrolisthes cinctipes]|uniref:Uncharacterized protein n=1 Tax=Petrolisthes cinctipes TaxID=88211 RepID=A0AAE1L174_PETCI|nr:hypothetical protein Pcinc_004273 [Petrolisthes cinctipes]
MLIWKQQDMRLKDMEHADLVILFQARIKDRMDPFVAMTKEEFVDRFRLPKHSVVELIGEIQEQLPAANDRRGT